MRRIQLFALLVLLACAASSAQLPSPAADPRAEFAERLFSISRGGVSIGRRGESQAGFQEYLDASTFQAWDDIVPPRIRISADGQMAYVVVQKRVHLTTQGPDGQTEAERTRFAWLSVYEKQAGQWRLSAIASTERPDSL